MSKQEKTEAAEESAGQETADNGEAAAQPDPAEEIAGLKAALNERHEAYLRAAAEAENIRRRAQKQVSEAFGRGQRQIARELLAAIDSLELGLDASQSASAEDLAEGQRAVLRQLLKALGQFGVETVAAEGEPFDPERHEAVSMQPSDSVAPQSVISVMQKGYLMQGRLLRAARVVVSSGPPQAPRDGDGSGKE